MRKGRTVPLDYAFDDWETVPVPGVFNLTKPEYFTMRDRRFTAAGFLMRDRNMSGYL